MTIAAAYWLWDGFKLKQENEVVLVLNEKEFRLRGRTVFLSLALVFFLSLVFKASIERELDLTHFLPWMSHLTIGLVTLPIMVALIVFFWRGHKVNHSTHP